ncbi:hypothetical protein RGU75_00030 [Glaciimonas sp. CA11.2]|uniref:hypothetical protein n=1 Tax=Glaciimonas sp. CA11.2 TaxID=3048601 RepID=UPI002AB35A09|nr:hypothetical protein [Glaciimonas sp. CA11.2]MDY7544626.1 hypothetical protein [Glaciimonas sp. CA11.2]
MGRQRTINDAEFWRSTKIADKTQEDKATLFYLLTSPFSNIVGVYKVVLKIAAAEMGWTADQLVPVLTRLNNANVIKFEEESGFIWVKIWWDHNSAKMAIATTLRQRTFEQIEQIPIIWRTDFIDDFLVRIPAKDSLRQSISFEIMDYLDTVSIPYPYARDRGAGNDNNTNNFIDTTNTTVVLAELDYPKLSENEISEIKKLIERISELQRQDVLDEIEGKRRKGKLKNGVVPLCRHFVENIERFVIADGVSVKTDRVAKSINLQHSLNALNHEKEMNHKVEKELANMDSVQFDQNFCHFPASFVDHLKEKRAALQEKFIDKNSV